MILFGSRARGDADQYSDMDIAVILNEPVEEKDVDYVSDCAWEAGFEYSTVVVPVVFTREEWENSPERSSPRAGGGNGGGCGMKEEDISVLIKYRLEQAQTALDDGQFLLDGGRSPQSVI